MDVTVEDLGGLKRKLSIEVPLEEVSGAYEAVYRQIRSNIRVDGFRPGKFPRQLAEKRFKTLMSQEALQTLVPRYLDGALKEQELHPATEPHFHNLDIDQKRPFKFDVEFEIVPEFELLPPSEYKLEEAPVELESEAVDQRIEELRESRAGLEDKGDAPAENGDFVTFDFEGTLDGEPFEGNTGTDQKTELGAGRYLEAFEQALLGVKADEEKSFPLTFPADYGEPKLANQTADFTVKVKRVERKKLPELDADFFAKIGEDVDSLETLRQKVEEQLRREKEQDRDQQLQEQLADQIKGRYDFEVPEAIIEGAVQGFERQQLEEQPELKDDPEKLEAMKAEERERQIANLRLAYVLGKHAMEEKIEVDPEELRNRFYMQAYMLRENPEELMRTRLGDMLLHQIQDNLRNQKTLARLVDRVLGRPVESDAPPEAAAAASGEASTAAETTEPGAEPAADLAEGAPAEEAGGAASDPGEPEPPAEADRP